MPKKAYLVGFATLTRIVIDVPEGIDPLECKDGASEDKWREIVRAAREKMAASIGDYLNGDNCDRLEEDTECPFGTLQEDGEISVLDKLLEKYKGKIPVEELPGGDAPSWTFVFDDNDCATLVLTEISMTGKEIFFDWRAPGYRHTETLNEMPAYRLNYVIESLKGCCTETN